MGDERQYIGSNTNETGADDVEAHSLSMNTNEIASDDEVDAHSLGAMNTNESSDEDAD